MRTGWVERIGDFRVERIRSVLRTGAAVDLSKPPICVIHTTQGGWDGSISRYRSELTTPTFQIGHNRIGQCIPLGEMAGALSNPSGGVETNRWARVQIELVCTVTDPPHRRPWLPDPGIVAPLVAMMRFLHEDCDIPLKRPFERDEVMEGVLASTAFARRGSGKWGNASGYFGHVEVPENDHWDPANMNYEELFERAGKLTRLSRTLRVTAPFMTGPDVERAQRLLAENRFADFAPGPVTGVFNLLTAQAAARAKFALGYPQDRCNGNFGQMLETFLSGRRRLPVDYRARRLARIGPRGVRAPEFKPSREIHPV